MKKRFVLLGSIIVISLIVSVSAFLIAKNTNNSPPLNSELTCNIIQENPGGINIVFFAEEEQAKKYSDYFLTVAPFNKHNDKFSFYFITPEQYKPACNLYQGIALLCQSSELTKAASVCPNDYIVVLESRPSSIRSSAFRGVMSLNTNHPFTVFAHEFAHVFDNFAEEYSSPGASIPRESENCQKKCENFREFREGLKDYGCHKECTESNYYREFQNGFMRSLQADRYGNLNENILEEEVMNQYDPPSKITGNVISTASSCQSEKYFLITQTENDFAISKERGCLNGAKTFGDETVIITDKTGQISQTKTHSNILFTTDLTSSREITAAPKIVKLPKVITVPSTGNEETLSLLDQNTEPIFQATLSETGASPCKV